MSHEIIMVRIYITEADKILKSVMDYLHNDIKVRGVTVCRAISGYGKSGALHSTELLTMALDLPLIIEFFDVPDKVNSAFDHLITLVGKEHIVSWHARTL